MTQVSGFFQSFYLKVHEKLISEAYHKTSVNVGCYDGVQVLRDFVCNNATHRNNRAQRRAIFVLVYFRQPIKVSVFVVSNSLQSVVKVRDVFLQLIYQFVDLILN